MPTDRGQRCSQLVGHAHQEVTLLLVRIRESGGHAAEALSEVADLVATPDVRQRDVVAAARDFVRRCRQREHRLRDPSRQVPGEQACDDDPAEERNREAVDERQQTVRQLGPRFRDDEVAELDAFVLAGFEAQRIRDGHVLPVCPRRRELEGDRPVRLPVGKVARRQDRQRLILRREHRKPDVVEPRAGRLLESRGGELRRRAVFLVCLLLVERGQTFRVSRQFRLQP